MRRIHPWRAVGAAAVKDLTEAQQAELADALSTFAQDRALDGLACVVILVGRGMQKTAYPADIADHVPSMLAAAYRATKAYNTARAN